MGRTFSTSTAQQSQSKRSLVLTIAILMGVTGIAVVNHLYAPPQVRDERGLASVVDMEVMAKRERWEQMLIKDLMDVSKSNAIVHTGRVPSDVERVVFEKLKGEYTTRRVNGETVDPLVDTYEVLDVNESVVGRLTVELSSDGKPVNYRFTRL